MDFQDDGAEFSHEDVDTIVKHAITGCLADVMYNPKKVRQKMDAMFLLLLTALLLLILVVWYNHSSIILTYF